MQIYYLDSYMCGSQSQSYCYLLITQTIEQMQLNMDPRIVVVFPFMSKGHTIPLLHLSRLLLRRGVAAVTIFTTPLNHPFISQSLYGTDNVTIIDLPFPDNIPGIPNGVESTDKLSSMSLFVQFVNATKSMQPFFEEALEKIHSKVICVISDGFLPWTLESASRFGIPRLNFYGMNYYAMTTCYEAIVNGLISLHESPDKAFTLPSFPWIKLTRNDFDKSFDKRDPMGSIDSMVEAATNSYGLLMNSFYELEPTFVDYYDRTCRPKAWSVGPLCLAQTPKHTLELDNKLSPPAKPEWMQWLDQKLAKNCPVLYVAFGSQAEISPTQLLEIGRGLEESKVNFLWVVRKNGVELSDGFEDRVKKRGMVVKEWVDQKEILQHQIVQGFLSHCGWNSVLEGICAEVPILAWPVMAEQHLNAKMVAEEIKIGLRVETIDGTAKGFVTGESLKKAVIEVMEGEKGNDLRANVKKVAKAARKAMEEDGSSWNALNQLIRELCRQKEINDSSKLE